MKIISLLAFFLLPRPCPAQQLHVVTLEPVDARKLRALPPSGLKTDAPSVTVLYGGRFPDNFTRGGRSYGSGGGAMAEFPVNGRGTSLVAGVSGIDSYRVYQEDGKWKQDRVRSFPVTLGAVQRLGRLGWGDALGERGFFVEPQVEVGVGPAGATTFAGPTADPEPYSNGRIETRQAVLPMAYVGGGVRTRPVKGVALGLEGRHYEMIGAADGARRGNYVFVTLTATPKLTGRLKKGK